MFIALLYFLRVNNNIKPMKQIISQSNRSLCSNIIAEKTEKSLIIIRSDRLISDI